MIKKIAASLAVIAAIAAPASAQEVVRPVVDVRHCIFTKEDRLVDLESVSAMVIRNTNTFFYVPGGFVTVGLTPEEYKQVAYHFRICRRPGSRPLSYKY